MIPFRDNVKSKTFPIFTLGLIAANLFVFFHMIRLADIGQVELFSRRFGLVPLELLRNPLAHWSQIFSSLFVHGGWLHLLGNMLYLWIFGDNVEDRLGHLGFLFFYFIVGSLSSLAQVIFSPHSGIPLIGASGAISGIMGAYFLLFPRAKVLTLIPIFIFLRVFELPAWLFLGFWFFIQAFNSFGTFSLSAAAQQSGGVAWVAHAAGFAFGGILLLFIKKR